MTSLEVLSANICSDNLPGTEKTRHSTFYTSFQLLWRLNFFFMLLICCLRALHETTIQATVEQQIAVKKKIHIDGCFWNSATFIPNMEATKLAGMKIKASWVSN